jgi:Sigma-70 factor, region 1.1
MRAPPTGLVVEGRERGYLTFEEIAACLEEVEVTKEQVRDLHSHLSRTAWRWWRPTA